MRESSWEESTASMEDFGGVTCCRRMFKCFATVSEIVHGFRIVL